MLPNPVSSCYCLQVVLWVKITVSKNNRICCCQVHANSTYEQRRSQNMSPAENKGATGEFTLCKVLSVLINYITFDPSLNPKPESHSDPKRWINLVFLYLSVMPAFCKKNNKINKKKAKRRRRGEDRMQVNQCKGDWLLRLMTTDIIQLAGRLMQRGLPSLRLQKTAQVTTWLQHRGYWQN